MTEILIAHADGSSALVDETALEKHEGCFENDDERTTWVEYRIPGDDRIVHRSVRVTLKRWPKAIGATAAKL